MSDLQSLTSMGFSKERAEEALIATNTAGIVLAIEWLVITDENNAITNEEDYTKAEIASLGDQLFNRHFEGAVRESLKETEPTCETKEASDSSEISINSNNNTRILVRLLDGKTISKVFNAQEKLNVVLLFIKTHITTEKFGLMTNFPKKVFTDEDYKHTLDALNLVPSAVLTVTQLEKWDNLKEYHGVKNDDESLKAEEKRRREEVEEQFKKMEEERLALERVRSQIEDDKAARKLRWPHLYQNSDPPSGNQLLQNQHQALTHPNGNQYRTRNKKFE